MSLALLLVVVLGCSADSVTDTTGVVPHSGFYVSVNGSPTDSGTRDHPWDLAHALAQPSEVHPGDTIWLRGGTYKGNFTSTLTGISGAPIVLRQFPSERATIDGRLDINGQYTFYWGFEVTDSDPLRVTATAGSRPADLPRNMVTVFVTGPFNKLINLVVHDLGDGLFSGSTAEGLEIYGSVFYNNGWIGPDRGHGHNLYLQNQNATKNVIDNVLFNSFDAGLHIYGSDVAYLWNFNIEGNTIFDSGDPAVGTFSTSLNILQHGGNGNYGRSVYRDNSIYQRDGRDFALAFNTAGGIPGQDIKFLKNIVHGQALFYEMNGYTITDNKFTSGTNPLSGSSVLVGLRMIVGQPYTSNTWNGNRYATPAGGTQDPFYLVGMSSAVYKFPLWQSTTGYDAGGSSTYGEFPGADVIVRPNRYESGRAFITCWNWNGASTVNVDLSSVLKPGDQFEIHHVFDLVGAPILTGTYDGGPVSIPQSTLTPPPPLGYKASPTMPDNRFNVFLVQKR